MASRSYRILLPKSAALIHGVMFNSTKASAAVSTATLEVERKFNATALLRSYLDGTYASRQQLYLSGPPQSAILKFYQHPRRHINDQYFDHDDKLSSKGIWVRCRTERLLQSQDFPYRGEQEPSVEWQAKVRIGGDYLNSEFEEISGEEQVMALVQQHLSKVSDLRRIVDLETVRETWSAKEEPKNPSSIEKDLDIKFVIDHSSAGGIVEPMPDQELIFKHLVGEVELTKEVVVGSSDEETDVAKKAAVAEMRGSLEGFMIRHAILFPTVPAPMGKLTAYFAWKKQVEDHLKESL